MNLDTLQFQLEGPVAWLRLNRPQALNALSRPMLAELDQVMDLLEQRAGRDDAVRVLVVTGNGRAFCAGADLVGAVAAGDGAGETPFLEVVQATLGRLRRLPLPVIAALNGITMGGGLELAMSCDILLAAEEARIADAHANVGVLPGAGGAAVLPRLIGPAYAKYLVFSGETVPAAELHRLGLIARLYPAAELEAGARTLAERLASKSPLGLARMKRLIDDGLAQPSVDVALRMELDANALHGHSEDFAEGVRAFQERRAPVFRGR